MADAAVSSPWHRGELAMQRRAGVAPEHAARVAPFLRTVLTDQHRAFYPLLPFIVAGAVDDAGLPWATILEGTPGFLQSPDDTHLRVAATPAADDPARAGFASGRAIGLLGIQLETRRRNRVNGRVANAIGAGFDLEVDRAYGNCPRYITTHELARGTATPAPADYADGLDAQARAAIARADMFFVASYADEGARGVDVSHRGGRPGFVDVDGDWLTVPDFDGNGFFNTLGNFLVNPRAGLLFVDFARGDLLQLTGHVELVFDGPLLARFAGAQRAFRVRVARLVRRRGALAWRGQAREASPASIPTGSWREARTRLAADAAPR